MSPQPGNYVELWFDTKRLWGWTEFASRGNLPDQSVSESPPDGNYTTRRAARDAAKRENPGLPIRTRPGSQEAFEKWKAEQETPTTTNGGDMPPTTPTPTPESPTTPTTDPLAPDVPDAPADPTLDVGATTPPDVSTPPDGPVEPRAEEEDQTKKVVVRQGSEGSWNFDGSGSDEGFASKSSAMQEARIQNPTAFITVEQDTQAGIRGGARIVEVDPTSGEVRDGSGQGLL